MKRTCEAGCGRRLDGRPDKRYCSEACSKRARRGAASAGPLPLPTADDSPDKGRNVRAVTAELERSGRLDTWLGAAALSVALRMDESTAVMGYAALVKELRSTMDAALAGVTQAADPVDELRAHRDRKYAG